MTYPILVLVLHLLVLIFQRTSQMRNQASMSMTRLYSDHEKVGKLIKRRNRFVNASMGTSVLAGIALYIIVFAPNANKTFLSSDFIVSIAEATKLGDTTPVLLVIMTLVLGAVSAVVGRQLSLQAKETVALLEANFLEERMNFDHIMMIEERLGELGVDVQRLVAEETLRLRAESMRQIK